MNWNSIIVAISLVMLTIFVTLWFLMTRANAGGPCSDQYCNAKVETIVVKNEQGEVIDKQSVETLICDDGRKDFLAFSGIAKECKEYWFEMHIAGQWQRKRGYVCQKFDGSWEMVNPQQ